MCYVSCQAQQKSSFLGFNLTSNSWWNPRRWPRWQPLLVKSQAPTAPPPIKYASSFREDKRLSTENKIVSQYCHKTKTLGGGVSTPPPPCTTIGVWIWSWLEWILQNQVSARRLELNKIIFRQIAPTLEISIQRLKKAKMRMVTPKYGSKPT